jgi:hypothetical protein
MRGLDPAPNPPFVPPFAPALAPPPAPTLVADESSGCTCQNTTTPARASPIRVKNPTVSTTVHTQACGGVAAAPCKIMTLPRKPGNGGSPAADAAPSISITPSNTGSRTDGAGCRRSPVAPRCAAINSTSKNSPATTSVLCSM